jgi:metal-sulfur cluster biosynthetic enzyme
MICVEDVRAALRAVADPCAIATGVPVDVVAMGLVRHIAVANAEVTVTLRLTSPFCMQIGLLSEQIDAVLRALPEVGTTRVEVDHLAEWMPEMMEQSATDALRRVRPLPVVTR